MAAEPGEGTGGPPAAGGTDFQQVWEAFQPRVRRYLARLAGAGAAEDLTQETFLRISQALGGFRGESSLSTWVYRVATNVGLDWLRSPASRVARQQVSPRVLTLLGTPPAVEQEVAREEMGQCIRGFIEQLPEDYRSVLVLSELAGLPDRQIAAVLDLTLETVKIRLHRARTRLREILERECTLSRDERNEFSCEPRPGPVSSDA
jgi:RNA polymerase sigma-70 factor (ECF subfamily)